MMLSSLNTSKIKSLICNLMLQTSQVSESWFRMTMDQGENMKHWWHYTRFIGHRFYIFPGEHYIYFKDVCFTKLLHHFCVEVPNTTQLMLETDVNYGPFHVNLSLIVKPRLSKVNLFHSLPILLDFLNFMGLVYYLCWLLKKCLSNRLFHLNMTDWGTLRIFYEYSHQSRKRQRMNGLQWSIHTASNLAINSI